MAALTTCAKVSFKEGTIEVSNGGSSRITSYMGNSAVPHMLIHILALQRIKANITLLDTIPSLKQKLENMRIAIENVGLEVVQEKLAKMSC